MNVDNDLFDLRVNFQYIEGQQSNIFKNGNLWFKNENDFRIFSFNIKSKYDLLKCSIFTEHSIPVTTR